MFYLSTDSLASYAANGSLEPYAADLENADAFFPSLREAFTYDDEFWCAPKDFSTLALVINTAVGPGRSHRRRHPHRLGRAGARRPTA